MKEKVLVYLLDKRDTTAFWRGVFKNYISHNDFEIVDISEVKVFDWTIFIGAKVLWFQRPFASEHLQVINAAKSMGIKVILDYDDNLLAVDMHNPTYMQYKNAFETTKKCIHAADEVWASTESIREAYLPLNQNIYVIPNSHNDYLFPVDKKRPFSANKKCIYRGGSSHQADVNSVANDLIRAVNSNKDWTFVFMGDRYTYLEMNCHENYHIVGGLTIMDYFRYLNQENPGVMIFPLCNTPFNAAKSNISWIEGTYSGAAFFGNTNLPEFKYCGYDVSQLGNFLNDTMSSDLERMNNLSWQLICDTLLLSNINQLRTERLLANL